MKRLLCLTLLSSIATFACADIYKWVDERGHIHYSDSCPVPHCELRSISAMPQPTEAQVRDSRESASRIKQRQQLLEQRRKDKQTDKQRTKEEEQKETVDLARRCARARQNLHALEQQRPVYTIDAKGKYVYVKDDERLQEIERLTQFVDKNCQ